MRYHKSHNNSLNTVTGNPDVWLDRNKNISIQNLIKTPNFTPKAGRSRLHGCTAVRDAERYSTRETVRNGGRIFWLVQIEIKVIIISRID